MTVAAVQLWGTEIGAVSLAAGESVASFEYEPDFAAAGIELTLETAKELRAALDRAIAAAEFEEAEVRGKGAVPRLVQAA